MQPREPLFPADWLMHRDYVEADLGVLKAGKESEVRLVARYGEGRASLLAEKRFTPRTWRAFKNDHLYWAPSASGTRRESRAMQKGTRKGREFIESRWIGAEWSNLVRLHDAGATVPPPVEPIERGYRMAFVGDDGVAAPRLASLRLDRESARRVYGQVLDELAILLSVRRVHGDLSPYNILYWRSRAVLIDFSQTVDIVMHPAALELLRRDLAHVCAYVRSCGVAASVDEAMRALDAERAIVGR